MSVEALVDEMPLAVGRRVRQARTSRGLTLDQLAERSGVSRRMIVNVEAGASNASIATLLRLSAGLQVSLGELVADGPGGRSCTVTSRDMRTPLWRGPEGGSADLVAHADTLELWDWTLEPGETYGSAAHGAGTRELIHVVSGRLRLTTTDGIHDLRAGDGASFAGDAPHSYACLGRRTVRFSMTVLEPLSRRQP